MTILASFQALLRFLQSRSPAPVANNIISSSFLGQDDNLSLIAPHLPWPTMFPQNDETHAQLFGLAVAGETKEFFKVGSFARGLESRKSEETSHRRQSSMGGSPPKESHIININVVEPEQLNAGSTEYRALITASITAYESLLLLPVIPGETEKLPRDLKAVMLFAFVELVMKGCPVQIMGRSLNLFMHDDPLSRVAYAWRMYAFVAFEAKGLSPQMKALALALFNGFNLSVMVSLQTKSEHERFIKKCLGRQARSDIKYGKIAPGQYETDKEPIPPNRSDNSWYPSFKKEISTDFGRQYMKLIQLLEKPELNLGLPQLRALFDPLTVHRESVEVYNAAKSKASSSGVAVFPSKKTPLETTAEESKSYQQSLDYEEGLKDRYQDLCGDMAGMLFTIDPPTNVAKPKTISIGGEKGFIFGMSSEFDLPKYYTPAETDPDYSCATRIAFRALPTPSSSESFAGDPPPQPPVQMMNQNPPSNSLTRAKAVV